MVRGDVNPLLRRLGRPRRPRHRDLHAGRRGPLLPLLRRLGRRLGGPDDRGAAEPRPRWRCRDDRAHVPPRAAAQPAGCLLAGGRSSSPTAGSSPRMYPILQENSKRLEDYMKIFPKELLAAFGMTGSLADPGVFFSDVHRELPVAGRRGDRRRSSSPRARSRPTSSGAGPTSRSGTPLTRTRCLAAAIASQALVLAVLAAGDRRRRAGRRRGSSAPASTPPAFLAAAVVFWLFALRDRRRHVARGGASRSAAAIAARRGGGRPDRHVPHEHRGPGAGRPGLARPTSAAFKYLRSRPS